MAAAACTSSESTQIIDKSQNGDGHTLFMTSIKTHIAFNSAHSQWDGCTAFYYRSFLGGRQYGMYQLSLEAFFLLLFFDVSF